MLRFKDLTLNNWPKFKNSVLNSESVFKKLIRETANDYINILSKKDSIAKIVLLDSKYIGNAIGFCPTKEEVIELKLKGIKTNKLSIYLSNFVIDPKYQNKGYGYLLLKKFIEASKSNGYKKLVGHFRKNTSLHLIEKFNVIKIKEYDNWFNTKETYVLCELEL
jgi:GNAT superfamily N-acetyltransferase